MGNGINELKKFIKAIVTEALEDDVEEAIENLRGMPEMQDIESFVNHKLNNDEFEFDFIELQALARNAAQARTGDERTVAASQADTERVRKTLVTDIGFKFMGRQPLKPVRGFSSPLGGTHPFAGAGGGGSGFSSDFSGGGGFTSFGGGPGAMGGGEKWDKDDPRALSMGAKKKVKR